jgi:peptidoglycan lytic transglycosylase D
MRRYSRFITIIGCFSVILSTFACSSGNSPRKNVNSAKFIREHNLKSMPRFDIPIVINDRVVAWMDYFQGAGRKHFQRYLERSGRYIPLMKKILAEEGVPQDLIYISMIESGFNVHAKSHASAVGPWQFIRSTGKRYNMKIDVWVDERRDPYLATRSAARYFKFLYGEFGDWYLAMAGYNAGEGRIRRGLKKTGARDFWELASHRRAIRAETRDYVPKFIAAAIIAKMPERFGFNDVELHDPFAFEVVSVETQTDLAIIAKCSGVKTKEILDLNPHLHRGATPHGRKNYKIRVPVKTSKKFRVAYSALPKNERIQIVRYRVKGGDTLSRIARRYGVSVRTLARVNNIKSYRTLRKGKTLIIPIGGAAKARYAKSASGPRTNKLITHRVKKGETAGTIANRYGVGTSDVRRWNNLNRRSTIRVGQKLKIYGRVASSRKRGGTSTASVTHRVRRGETLGGIANRHGISTKKLMAMNGIRDPRKVRAGKKLVIKKRTKRIKNTTAIPVAELSTSKAASRSRSVKYKVKPGETLGGIANRNGVTVKQLMAWNKIKNVRSVRAGKTLIIRKRSAPKVSAKPVNVASKSKGSALSSSSRKYKVKPGETLGGIANRNGVTVKQLMAWNKIKDVRSVRAGQTLRISGGSSRSKSVASTPAKLSSTTPAGISANVNSGITTYHVKNGDTLWDIARRHRVTIAQLQRWNKLTDPSSVRPGTRLKIYEN